MQTIYKYPLDWTDHTTVEMPEYAWPLSAGVQDGRLVVWVEVDPNETRHTTRVFYVVGTGHPVPPEAWRYLNTVFLDSLVFHVYDGMEK